MPSAKARPLYVRHSLGDGARSLFARRPATLPPHITAFFGEHAVPLESGRGALTLALKVLQIRKRARVGVPVYTCTGVFDAIVAAGHVPVFLDIELERYAVDPTSLAERIGAIDALVAVHTFGHPYDAEAVGNICGDRPVIEDCAHSMTAEYRGKRVGSFGDAAIYSFRPGKLIGSGGGGMLVLRDVDAAVKSRIASMTRLWSRSGLLLHYIQAVAGGSLKRSIAALDSSGGVPESQAVRLMAPGDIALLEDRLPSLGAVVAAHRRNASSLLKSLDEGRFHLPGTNPKATHDYYLFALRFDSEEERRKAQLALQRAGIGAFQLYHVALHRARDYGYKGDCPNAETAAKNALMLPVHPGVSEAAIGTMIETLNASGGGG